MKTPYWLMIAAYVLALFTLWLITQTGAASFTYASPLAATSISFSGTAHGGRAVFALVCLIVSGLLFLIGLASGLVIAAAPRPVVAARSSAGPPA